MLIRNSLRDLMCILRPSLRVHLCFNFHYKALAEFIALQCSDELFANMFLE